MRRFLSRFLSCRRGATAIEYALILACVFLGMMAGIDQLSPQGRGMFGHIAQEVSSTADKAAANVD